MGERKVGTKLSYFAFSVLKDHVKMTTHVVYKIFVFFKSMTEKNPNKC